MCCYFTGGEIEGGCCITVFDAAFEEEELGPSRISGPIE